MIIGSESGEMSNCVVSNINGSFGLKSCLKYFLLPPFCCLGISRLRVQGKLLKGRQSASSFSKRRKEHYYLLMFRIFPI